MSIRILIADSHKIIRDYLRSLLEKEADMKVIAEAGDGQETLQLARKLSPDVVIMDIGTPDLNGIEATRRIVADVPGVKEIGLSMHSDRRFVAGMLSAGASGYLLKDCAFEELSVAIRAVVVGQTYLSPGIGSITAEHYASRLPQTKP